MYVPPAFAETDRSRLFDFIEANSFGLLISRVEQTVEATHLPLLLARDAGPHGRIVGHMARANRQWRSLTGQDVLCVFSGPHAYVSPSWYEAADTVPTWNYVAVHAYGTCRVVADLEKTAQIVADYVATYESSMPKPWRLDRSTSYFQKLVKAIVGFHVDIHRIEGKWKLGQNHPAERREKAARALAASDEAKAQSIAQLMFKTLR